MLMTCYNNETVPCSVTMFFSQGDVATLAPPASAMVNYVTAGFAVMFAVLCIIIIIVCSVQLMRYRRHG